jgi:hypothetical protein
MSQPPTGGWPTGEPQEPQGGWPQQPQQPWGQPGQPSAPQQPSVPPQPYGQPGQQPQYPPPGQYGQPGQPGQYGQPGQQPQYPPPGQYGQPGQYVQPGQYGQQPGQWESLGGAPAAPYQPPKRGGRGRLIAAAVAVVALAGGGVATYVAVSDSSSKHGAASPNEAVQNVVDDINKSDLIGVLDDLPPGERDTLSGAFVDDIAELKRLNVLQSSADPKHVDAVHTSIKDLTFAAPVKVNDHVQVAQLTGGTVSFSADISKVPFTAQFLKALFPSGAPAGQTATTGNVADAVRHNDGKPIRIATQKVDGRWYPSLFYTIADNAATDGGSRSPGPSDYIAAKGGSSPTDAVKQLVTALLEGKPTRAIELLSPTELAAVHDYAGMILKNTGASYPAAPVHLDDLQLTAKPAARGAQAVTLTSVALTTDTGEKISVKISGDCVDMTLPGQGAQHLCSAQIADMLDTQLSGFGGTSMTPAQKQAVQDLFGGSTMAVGGIITTQTDGQWYVNPVRTELEATTALLKPLKGDDLLELIGLVRQLSGG